MWFQNRRQNERKAALKASTTTAMAELASSSSLGAVRPTPRGCEISEDTSHIPPSPYSHYTHTFLPPLHHSRDVRYSKRWRRGPRYVSTRHACPPSRSNNPENNPRFRARQITCSVRSSFHCLKFSDFLRQLDTPLYDCTALGNSSFVAVFLWCPIYELSTAPLCPGLILLGWFCRPRSYLLLQAKTSTFPHGPYCEFSVGDYSQAG